ncbi:hypothetical protein JJL56_30330 [Azospirillum sp. YIM DDC1]|uniref:DUF2927 domain-containing protein n=1 Tax=Azospirillum aestuarii TaxID=2802052 RepID=A0ABS1I896_9PROT|nr:hypothetical protein [Azospirillum aestuarii]MBK4723154.1 hypothetical protein [Azospirillum aestuarii]
MARHTKKTNGNITSLIFAFIFLSFNNTLSSKASLVDNKIYINNGLEIDQLTDFFMRYRESINRGDYYLNLQKREINYYVEGTFRLEAKEIIEEAYEELGILTGMKITEAEDSKKTNIYFIITERGYKEISEDGKWTLLYNRIFPDNPRMFVGQEMCEAKMRTTSDNNYYAIIIAAPDENHVNKYVQYYSCLTKAILKTMVPISYPIYNNQNVVLSNGDACYSIQEKIAVKFYYSDHFEKFMSGYISKEQLQQLLTHYHFLITQREDRICTLKIK